MLSPLIKQERTSDCCTMLKVDSQFIGSSLKRPRLVQSYLWRLVAHYLYMDLNHIHTYIENSTLIVDSICPYVNVITFASIST